MPRPAYNSVLTDSALQLPPQDLSKTLGDSLAASKRDFDANFHNLTKSVDGRRVAMRDVAVRPNSTLGMDIDHSRDPSWTPWLPSVPQSQPNFWGWQPDMTRKTYTLYGE